MAPMRETIQRCDARPYVLSGSPAVRWFARWTSAAPTTASPASIRLSARGEDLRRRQPCSATSSRWQRPPMSSAPRELQMEPPWKFGNCHTPRLPEEISDGCHVAEVGG